MLMLDPTVTRGDATVSLVGNGFWEFQIEPDQSQPYRYRRYYVPPTNTRGSRSITVVIGFVKSEKWMRVDDIALICYSFG